MTYTIWKSFLVFIGLFAVMGSAETTRTGAQRLAEKMPEDVLGFMTTSGGDELKPAFDQSHLGRLWHEASVQAFYGQIKEAGLKQLKSKAKDDQERSAIDYARSLLNIAGKCPVLAGVCERPAEKGTPPVCLFFIVDAGKYQPAMNDAVKKLLATAEDRDKVVEMNFGGTVMHGRKDKDETIYWGWVKDYFLLAFNDKNGKLIFDLQKNRTAASQPAFLSAMAKVPGTDDAVVFVADVEKILRLIARELKDNEKEPTDTMDAILDLVGLKGLRTIVNRTGFSEGNLVGNGLAEMSGARKGIFAALKPVDLEWLDAVPEQAVSAGVYNIDLEKLYDTAIGMIKAIPGKDKPDIDKAVGEFEVKAKTRIREELLAGLAGPAVVYTVPAASITPLAGGGVAILKLKDPKVFEKALTRLEAYIAEIAEGKFQVTSQEMDGVKYHFWMIPQLAMMQISPCWTISGNKLVITTSMPLCSAAVRHATTQNARAVSVRATEGFKSVTKELPGNLISFRYVDQKRQGDVTMQVMQQLWPMVVMILNQQGKINLPMILPPATDIVKHLGPQAEYSWVTPEGIRSHNEGPVMSSDASAVGVTGIIAATLMPALGRAREMARRAVSANNLRQVYVACHQYSTEHDGKLPSNLEELVKEGCLEKNVLESPLKPKNFDGPSYIYIPGFTADTNPRNVVAYENPGYLSEGTNVLYGDGHVQWVKPEEFKKALAETYQRLGKPAPEVKFRSGKGGWDLGNLFKPEKAATRPGSGVNLEKRIPFKCTNCQTVVFYTIQELQKMQKPGTIGPMMGPMTLECPKCKKKTLTQAVECPKCGEVFVMKGKPDDKCPKCGASYAKVWMEKYGKERK